MQHYSTIIVGGGAAGFFTAINLAQQAPNQRIAILERGKDVLQKVRISGGGRCNVTHAEFMPKELSTNYPRGEKELLGPFHSFMTGDTIAWFQEHGVELKIEEDGRMFPTSDSSQTIIDCFLSLSRKHKTDILTSHNVTEIRVQDNLWQVSTKKDLFICEHLVITAGSSPKVWELMKGLGHRIVDAVPSLFTFNVANKKITALAGIAVDARVEIPELQLENYGPLLITHWGFSGPAILKLSAWGARELHQVKYEFDLVVNWLNHITTHECYEQLIAQRHSKKQVANDRIFDLPKRLWKHLVESSKLDHKTWADCSNVDLERLAQALTKNTFVIKGKSTFKEEFVTAGGVDLKEINFKTFASRKHDHLYLAGEVLNIDAITGGFNFQNAWTGGWMIARAIAQSVS